MLKQLVSATIGSDFASLKKVVLSRQKGGNVMKIQPFRNEKNKFLPVLFFLISFYSFSTNAQYFGKNKPGYEVFNYNVYQTPNFEIYHYFKNDTILNILSHKCEDWYRIHSTVFDDSIHFRNPMVFYKDQSDFQQTTVSNSMINVGTGGFTEGLKNRVVMPLAQTYEQTDHVLGHELVHAFQYNLLLNTDSLSLKEVSNIPLWMIEGMAEYMSTGSKDANTSMIIRDAIIHDYFPTLNDLTKKGYNPYRYGQAFWTFATKIWGDSIIRPLFTTTAKIGYKAALDSITGFDEKTVSEMWKSATELHYKSLIKDTIDSMIGYNPLKGKNGGDINISPSISPDGTHMIFMSEKNLYTLQLFLADIKTGKVKATLTSSVRNNEIDDFNWLESSGTWSPDSKKFAYVVFSRGKNWLYIVEVNSGKIEEEREIPGIEAFSNPTWSPDGKSIVIAGLINGRSDLYQYSLDNHEVKQLTFDGNSNIQPTWSDDGKKIAYVTGRASDQRTNEYLSYTYNIAILDINSGESKILPVFAGADNLNPQFANKDQSLLFLSDRDGFRNLYQYDFSSEKVYQLTEYLLGINGITKLSPAMSVSENNDVVYSYYSNKEYNIYKANLSEFEKTGVAADSVNFAAATLPPYKRVAPGIVDSLLTHRPLPKKYYTDVEQYTKIPYRPKFQLDYISNVNIGVSTGRINSGMAGGVTALFSDMVGDNQLFANLSLNGEVFDFGGVVAYMNQKKKINWGGAISHIPYRFGSLSYLRDTLYLDGEAYPVNNYALDIIRMFETKISAFAYLPISTTQRIETGISAATYNYRYERYNNYFDDYYLNLGQSREKLDAPDGFNLLQADVAYVFDNSRFGLTSPLSGQRMRFQLMRNFGFYDYYSTLADYRKYLYMKPLSLAFRFYNYNRIGENAESNRISPLFLGYGWYVRGYDSQSYQKNLSFDEHDVSINQLTGSRMVVSNLELRLPLSGPKQMALIKSNYFFVDLALFLDGGLIWDSEHVPSLKWQPDNINDRIPVFSTGASVRVNILGYLVVEPYYAFPLQRRGLKGGVFGLNFIPGW